MAEIVNPAMMLRRVVFAASLALLPPWAARAAASTAQASFASPAAAATALSDAIAANDDTRLRAILGPGSEKLLKSGDRYADLESRRVFAAAYAEHHALVPQPGGRTVLVVGANDWPLPIPLVQSAAGWRFDSAAGAQELVDRRIGRNEIAAIRVALAYVDAQHDYFERIKQRTGSGEYAQRLVATPGRQDGLYWPAAKGGAQSPLAPLVAQAAAEGYPGERVAGRPTPYQGYYFKILKGQGADAPDGARGYVTGGRMSGGFALLAWPAAYGSSGIMSFEVDQDGSVFQRDLGNDTATLAARITRFNPDLTWARINVVAQ